MAGGTEAAVRLPVEVPPHWLLLWAQMFHEHHSRASCHLSRWAGVLAFLPSADIRSIKTVWEAEAAVI